MAIHVKAKYAYLLSLQRETGVAAYAATKTQHLNSAKSFPVLILPPFVFTDSGFSSLIADTIRGAVISISVTFAPAFLLSVRLALNLIELE